jgi:hypothetical protein
MKRDCQMSRGLTDKSTMISRNLARRLENLESRVVPVDEPQPVVTLNYVDPDGQVVETREMILGGAANRNGSAWRARQWARARPRVAYR